MVSNEEPATVARAKARQQHRAFTRLSQQIALAILDRLETLNWSQKKLADAMGETPQQVNKWVKGGENFTLEALVNLEAVLDTTFIHVEMQEPVKKVS